MAANPPVEVRWTQLTGLPARVKGDLSGIELEPDGTLTLVIDGTAEEGQLVTWRLPHTRLTAVSPSYHRTATDDRSTKLQRLAQIHRLVRAATQSARVLR